MNTILMMAHWMIIPLPLWSMKVYKLRKRMTNPTPLLTTKEDTLIASFRISNKLLSMSSIIEKVCQEKGNVLIKGTLMVMVIDNDRSTSMA